MIRAIPIYIGVKGSYAYWAPDPEEPVLFVLTAGAAFRDGNRVALARVGGGRFSANGLVLSARARMFRLRVWADRQVARATGPKQHRATSARLRVRARES